ncbi:hypothetical protein [Lacipirellula sp.]|uniref:hypothetical protein n=1 Tax=Lacipirellula sp. TaxID=2691419 RepID=UPI003D1464BF
MKCPRCDGQGVIRPARINANGLAIWLCDECDAVWSSPSEISSKGNFVDFSHFVARFGLKGLWSEITILDSHAPAADPARESEGRE